MSVPLIYVGRSIAAADEVFEDTDWELQDLVNLEVRWASFGSASSQQTRVGCIGQHSNSYGIKGALDIPE